MLSSLRQKIYKAEGARGQLKDRLSITKRSLKVDKFRIQSIEKAQALVQHTAQETQEQLRYHVEDIVNSALDTCYPGKYKFIMNFEIKRGRTECSLLVDKDGELLSPLDDNGGGLCDIIGLGLRPSAWVLNKTDNFMVLDEPFKLCDKNLRKLAGHILKQLSQKLELQLLIISHDDSIINIADRIFQVTMKDGKSKVEQKISKEEENDT